MVAEHKRVYIDTMIFIKHLFNATHPLHSKIENFFNDISNQMYKGITSSFTRSEYLAVIKEILATKTCDIPSQTEITQALEIFDKFIDKMGIEVFDSDDLARSHGMLFSECHKRIEIASPIKGNNTRWRILGDADSIILLLAERCNSNMLATNDDGFKGMISHVTPLIVKVINAIKGLGIQTGNI